MQFKHSEAYENTDFFNEYIKRRNRTFSPNNILEYPIVSDLIGDCNNFDILELGCGQG